MYLLGEKEYKVLKIWTDDSQVALKVSNGNGKKALIYNGQLVGWFNELHDNDNWDFRRKHDLEAFPNFFLIAQGDGWGYVINGELSKLYPKVEYFRSNGDLFTFQARNAEGKVTYVINAKEQGWYDYVGWIHFFEDGHFAFTAELDGKWFYILDGEKITEHVKGDVREGHNPIYQDGVFAYSVRRGDNCQVKDGEHTWVVDGEILDWNKEVDKIFLEKGHFIFHARRGNEETFILDGKPQGWHPVIRSPRGLYSGICHYFYLNEDPTRIAFVVYGYDPERRSICSDGKTGNEYAEIKSPRFAEGTLVYLAKTLDDKWTVVVEHESGELCDTEDEATHSDRYREYFMRREDTTSKVLPSS